MELRNLTQFSTDYLDAYCEAEFGHTNWEFAGGSVPNWYDADQQTGLIAKVVVFFVKPDQEELDEVLEIEEEINQRLSQQEEHE